MKFRLKSLVVSVFIFILVLPLCSCKKTSADSRFESLSKDYFVKEMSDNALTLHYCLSNPDKYGICCDASFGDLSRKARKEDHSQLEAFIKDLSSIRAKSLSSKDRLDYDTLSFYLNLQDNLYEYELYAEPLSPNNGIQAQLPILLAEYAFYDKEDVENYLTLLGNVDCYLEQILSFEEEKIQAGLFMSDENCVQVIESCESFLENREKNFLFSTFSHRLEQVEGLTDDEIASYVKCNSEALWDHVFPAYENMIHRLTSMLGCGRNDYGLCTFEKGAEYYALLATAYTGSDMTMEELFDAIAAAREEDLLEYRSLFESDSTLLERLSDKKWEDTDEDSMISTLLASMQADFPEPVTTDYSLSFVEECLQPYLAPAFYITAPYDNYMENRIFVNTAKTYPSISYFTTLAHEGFPGHLYQTTMSYDYGLSPMRFCLDFPGYTEGWATYVEMMAYDYAGLDENVALALRLNQTTTLSLYATSDIGIHYYGWKTEDMQKFWAEYGITDENVINEITQLILSEPGNYLKYYVGYLEFEGLKDDMMATYGEDFSLSAFHEAILRMGPAPFSVLRNYLKDYYSLCAK